MADSSADRDPLDRLAEEFVARFRAGERPSLTEYADRLPDRADEVRDLFPALVEMEQLKPVTADQTGGYVPTVEPSDPVRLGDFRILRRVGAGGMGVVYEAVQESLGRHVALKLLPAEAFLEPKKLERFRREAKSAAKLHHTNIVPVFGTGEADGRHFYAMQFISGHLLDAVIDEVKRLKEKSGAVAPVPSARAVSAVAAALVTGTFAAAPESPSSLTVTHAPTPPDGRPLPAPSGLLSDANTATSPSFSGGGNSYWATVARVGAQVADALAYAHQQGIQHRDIKPANLLLDLRGTVWITDFGLAKASDADDGLTQMGDIVGTLRYMAPERFDGTGDHRADIYALGLTLYELLTLTPAFAASNRRQDRRSRNRLGCPSTMKRYFARPLPPMANHSPGCGRVTPQATVGMHRQRNSRCATISLSGSAPRSSALTGCSGAPGCTRMTVERRSGMRSTPQTAAPTGR